MRNPSIGVMSLPSVPLERKGTRLSGGTAEINTKDGGSSTRRMPMRKTPTDMKKPGDDAPRPGLLVTYFKRVALRNAPRNSLHRTRGSII